MNYGEGLAFIEQSYGLIGGKTGDFELLLEMDEGVVHGLEVSSAKYRIKSLQNSPLGAIQQLCNNVGIRFSTGRSGDAAYFSMADLEGVIGA